MAKGAIKTKYSLKPFRTFEQAKLWRARYCPGKAVCVLYFTFGVHRLEFLDMTESN